MKLSADQIERWLETDPSMIPYFLRYDPDVTAAGLNDLVWQLAVNKSCTRNDVVDLLCSLEQYLSLQEMLRELNDE